MQSDKCSIIHTVGFDIDTSTPSVSSVQSRSAIFHTLYMLSFFHWSVCLLVLDVSITYTLHLKWSSISENSNAQFSCLHVTWIHMNPLCLWVVLSRLRSDIDLDLDLEVWIAVPIFVVSCIVQLILMKPVKSMIWSSNLIFSRTWIVNIPCIKKWIYMSLSCWSHYLSSCSYQRFMPV